jgi:hypothetical protein
MEQLAQNLTLSLPLNFTAVVEEAQARLDPVCEAAGVPSVNCTLQNAALAIGIGAVLILQTLRGPDEEPGKKRKKKSSESDDESEAAQAAAAEGKSLLRPSRPPERFVDSSDEETTEQENGATEAAVKNKEEEEDDEEEETEEGLLERRQAIVDGRPARMKAAIDELTALNSSDDVAQICDALRKHAGKPADCRPAWLALQARLRTLVKNSAGDSGEDESSPAAARDGSMQKNPACTETS